MPHHTASQQSSENLENYDECENVVSNLPLLFAGGYPTSLEKISESQLEAFIPFMVQCSLGHVQISSSFVCSEPEWWPEQVEFVIPLRRPPKYTATAWLAKLKEIVVICYAFHKSIFLLRFCENLSSHQPESLRFINNHNSTTSLFDRFSNKLLVTFRNENMMYDQAPINSKKTLMPRTQSSQSLDNNNERMVEHALFDIYLCDNCEAELYSLEAFTEHEKICQDNDDDDVIFLGPEEYEPIDDNTQQQSTFLQNFCLGNKAAPNQTKLLTPHKRNHHHMKDDALTPEMKLRRLRGRSRTVMILAKCPTIPISSPAGQRLMNAPKTCVNNQYVMERLDRCERFCAAPPLRNDNSAKPKLIDTKQPRPMAVMSTWNPPTMRRSNAYCHTYRFPRRQYSQKWQQRAFQTLHSILLKQSNCKPVRIQLKRLTNQDIESIRLNSRLDHLKRLGQITLTRKTAIKTNVIDFIDLCSSDEESGPTTKSIVTKTRSSLPRLNITHNRRNSTNNSINLQRTFDALLSDAVTIEPISPTNNNVSSKQLQFKSATMKRITASQRRFTMHSDRLSLLAQPNAQPTPSAMFANTRNQSSRFPYQNQENTCRYLNSGTVAGPATRPKPAPTKHKKAKSAAALAKAREERLAAAMMSSPAKEIQKMISIDLT